MNARKLFTFASIGILLNVAFLQTPGYAETKAEKRAVKVRSAVEKLGTGSDSRVKVKLRDKTKIKGHISEISETTFTVIDERTNKASEISYSQVQQVKGNNLSTGAKIAIAFGVFAIIAILIAVRGI